MAIIIEDGSIVSGANSYVSEAELEAFAAARGITLTQDSDILLIQAMDYIEAQNYQGRKVSQNQPLQWPRYDVMIDGYYINSDVIPYELKNSLMQTAIAIDEGNGPLNDIQQKVIRKKVDGLEIQYSEGGVSSTFNRRIISSLYKLLIGRNSGNNFKVSKG